MSPRLTMLIFTPSQSEPATFNVRMPVEYLGKKGQVDNVYTYSSERVLKVGEQGDLIRGGNDGSNDVAESDIPASFRESQLNRAAVGGGSAIRNSETIVEPEVSREQDDIEEFLAPLSAESDIWDDTETATETENEEVFF